MGKILVTGATGHIGKLTLQNLLKRKIPGADLAALVRDPAKAQDLKDLGIGLRQGDYLDPPSLLRAFKDVEKLMLVSGQAFTNRKEAHANVIDAAAKAGVKHIVFMPIARKAGSTFSIKDVTDEDLFTEEKIRATGIPYTFVMHPPFLNTLPSFFGAAPLQNGFRFPEGHGKLAPATRENLAEAHGAVLTQPGHENKTYRLTGSVALSLAELAETLSRASGKHVPYTPVTEKQYAADRMKEGAPDFVAAFLLEWVKGFNAGEWDQVTGDLEKLLGHKATTPEEFFRRS